MILTTYCEKKKIMAIIIYIYIYIMIAIIIDSTLTKIFAQGRDKWSCCECCDGPPGSIKC
jgi:hypothetical protein